MRVLLPALILLGVAWLGASLLGRVMKHRNERIRADMSDATVDERVTAAVAKGHTGKLVLGGFVMLAVAATGTIWLLIVLVRIVL
jgi:hypothetical protein